MRLGEHITITIDDARLTLRPSLRAAVLLNQAHGLELLASKVLDGHATVIADLMAVTGDGWRPDQVLALLSRPGLLPAIQRITPALAELCLALMGFDPDAEEAEGETKGDEPRITFSEAHAKLYRIGTGWLGWTPAETWTASPLEIRAAYEGRVELLRAVFGSGEKPTKPIDRATTADERFTAGIRAIGTTKIRKAA